MRRCHSSAVSVTVELWHRRMGHRNYRSLAYLQRLGLLHGCRLTPVDFVLTGLTPCEACIDAKTHRASHTAEAVKTSILLIGLLWTRRDHCLCLPVGVNILKRYRTRLVATARLTVLKLKFMLLNLLLQLLYYGSDRLNLQGFMYFQR